MSKIIDVSEWQSSIDWEKVKEAGVDYAIIRVGGRYGISGHIYDDEYSIYNCTQAIKNNIGIGLYFFTQAVNLFEAEEEAEFVLDFIKNNKIKISLPIYIDSEYLTKGRHNFLTKKERTDIIKAFCERIKKEGYKAGVYANLSWFEKQIEVKELNYSIWVAQYNESCDFKYSYDIWQYSSSGKIDGIKGYVDLNKFNKKEKDYPDKIKIMAVDVIRGKYGNGSQRVKALGEYYEEVQELVNELMK